MLVTILIVALIVVGVFLFLNKTSVVEPNLSGEKKTDEVSVTDRMPDHLFWGIIDKTRQDANEDYARQKELLTEGLKHLKPRDIIRFDNTFRHYRGLLYDWQLWAAATILNGECSADCFSDFRGWLISRGKKKMEQIRKNPELLAELVNSDEIYWEGMGYCAIMAYQEATGEEMPLGLSENMEIHGSRWQDDELPSLFPRLWSKFGSKNTA